MVLLVRHRRGGMGEGDVVTTIVITTVHSVIHVFLAFDTIVLIFGLVNGAASVGIVIEVEFLDTGESSEHCFVCSLAGAVRTDTEIVLYFEIDDGPLGTHGTIIASVIVVDEKLVFWASLLTRGEHGVNEEDGRLENLAAVIDGLPHTLGAIVERPHIWN